MSYCRFLEGDVYAYACDGGVQFWIAGEGNRHLDQLCNTYGDAYQYIKELREEHGLDVPSHAVDALREDAIEEASRICEPIVDELQSENAKLRELCEYLWSFAKTCGAYHPFLHELGVEVDA